MWASKLLPTRASAWPQIRDLLESAHSGSAVFNQVKSRPLFLLLEKGFNAATAV